MGSYTRYIADAAMEWRDDLKPTEKPSGPGTIVTHAEDDFASEDRYRVTIRHVVAFGGYKGFIATVYGPGSLSSGAVHPGTDAAAYKKAMLEGLQILRKALDELERRDDRQRDGETPN